MRRSLLLAGAALCFGLLLQSCNYKENKVAGGTEPTTSPQGPGEPGHPTPSPEPPQEWFSAIRTKIFQPKCISCHKPGNTQGDVDLTNYQIIVDPESQLIVKKKPKSSRLYRCLIDPNPDKRMPLKEAPLTDAEIQIIYNWIEKGAPQNAPTDLDEADDPEEEPDPGL